MVGSSGTHRTSSFPRLIALEGALHMGDDNTDHDVCPETDFRFSLLVQSSLVICAVCLGWYQMSKPAESGSVGWPGSPMDATGTQSDGENVVQNLAYMWFVPSDSALAVDNSHPGPALAAVCPPSFTSVQHDMACGACRRSMLVTKGTLTCSNPLAGGGGQTGMVFLKTFSLEDEQGSWNHCCEDQ